MKIKTLSYALYAATISIGANLSAPIATWGLEGDADTDSDCAIDVNDTCYSDFSSALAAVEYNTWDTYNVRLHRDIVDDSTAEQWFIGSNTLLDLNGYNLSTGRQYYVYGANLTITGNGTFSFNNDYALSLFGGSAADDGVMAHLIVDEGVTLQSDYSGGETYMIGAYNKDYGYGITVDFNGRIRKGDDNQWLSAFYVNGSITEAQPVFNIGSAADINVDFGAYFAGNTEVNYSGAMNTKENGIEIRAGEINITGGSIAVDGATSYSVTPNGNGSTTYGAAVALAQHSTKLPLSANIYSGTLSAAMPFSEANPQNNPAEDIAKVRAQIPGGTFISSGDATIKSTDLTGFISGGSYNVSPDINYVAEKYSIYQTGANYRVLPTAGTDAEDSANPEDGEIAKDNVEVLSDIAVSAMNGILANYDSLENNEYTFDNGLKVKIEDADVLRAAIAEGKTISTKLVKSDGDITSSLDSEEVSRLYAAKAAGSETLGIFDFSIALYSETGGLVAHITELGSEVSFAFDVSSSTDLADGYTRTYQVIRHHNGLAEEISSEYDSDAEIIKFSTNKFSSFLIAYTDTEVATEEESGLAGLPNTGANNAPISSGSATSSATVTSLSAISLFTGLFAINLIRNRIRRNIYRK